MTTHIRDSRAQSWTSLLGSDGAQLCALGLLLGLLCMAGLLGSCASSEGPFVRLHLTNLSDDTEKIVLNITAAGQTKTARFSGSDPFSEITVSLPMGTTGSVTFAVEAYGAMTCLRGTATGSLEVSGDGIFDLPLTIEQKPLCGIPSAKLTVQVVTGAGAAGSVASTPAGIDCGTSCEKYYVAGTQLKLSAKATTGTFVGWSGGTCTGSADCSITIADKDLTIQAVFTACRGWCTEPSGTTANLTTIWGTASNNVVAAGAGGTIVKWDGQSWVAQQSPVTTLIRAASSARGDANIILVGDTGTIVRQNGTAWAKVTSPSSANLYAAAGATTDEMYIVGANGTYLKGSVLANSVKLLPTGGTGNPPAASTGKQLNAISVSPLNSEHLTVGGGGYNLHRYTDTVIVFNNDTIGDTVTGTSADLTAVYYGQQGMFAAGAAGTLVRRLPMPGSNWVVQPSPVSANLRGMWGSADNNIYAVGEGGSIVQYDGSNWTKTAIPNIPAPINTTNFNAVWGTGPNNIYVVGEGGTILHYLP